MTMYSALNGYWQGLIALCLSILMFSAGYIIICQIQQKMGKKVIAFSAFFFLLSFVIFQGTACMNDNEGGFDLPVVCLILFLMADLTVQFMQYRYMRRWKETHLSMMSVKDAFDNLPLGLVYYLDGGLPLLVNRRQEEICQELSGRKLMNANEFASGILNGTYPGCLEHEPIPLYRLKDGTVLSFTHNRLELEGRVLHEMMSVDVTQEYQIRNELKIRQDEERAQRENLRKVQDQLVDVTIRKEMMETRIRIHDDWSMALLAARRFLLEPEKGNRQQIIDLMRRSVWRIQREEEEEMEAYQRAFNNAELLGITIEINGELPEQPTASRLCELAMVTALSNLKLHAEGDRLWILSENRGESYRLSFSNNGEAPEEKIEERGGLRNLRRIIEQNGGSMKVSSRPAFLLQIEVPCS